MLHVTAVLLPSGLNANSDLFEPWNGRVKSTLIDTSSLGWLSVTTMRPSPTLSLPDQVKPASLPAGAPSKPILALGSSLAHGDHACHWCRSFTCANTVAAGAAMV